MIKLKFFVVPMLCIAFGACQQTSNSKEQPADTVQVTEDFVIEAPAEKVMNDTIGVYKITDLEAREFVVAMNSIISDIERAMDNNNPNAMPRLMEEINENQKKQLKIQSKLSKSDRELFNTYAQKIADRLGEMVNRMNKM